MHVVVTSYKGGVGKTTTAIHIAGECQKHAPTLLLDGDRTHNAIEWSEQSNGLPFRVAEIRLLGKLSPQFTHFVYDSGQAPTDDDMKHMAEGADLIVIPAAPAFLDTQGLRQTIMTLQKMDVKHYRVLITKSPTQAAKKLKELQDLLHELEVPVFKTAIPRLEAYAKASAEGVLVSQVKDERAERAAEAYESIGKEVLKYASS